MIDDYRHVAIRRRTAAIIIGVAAAFALLSDSPAAVLLGLSLPPLALIMCCCSGSSSCACGDVAGTNTVTFAALADKAHPSCPPGECAVLNRSFVVSRSSSCLSTYGPANPTGFTCSAISITYSTIASRNVQLLYSGGGGSTVWISTAPTCSSSLSLSSDSGLCDGSSATCVVA